MALSPICDDVRLIDNDSLYVDSLVLQLKKSFDMTDLSSLIYFLGLEIKRQSSEIFVNLVYTRDLLSRFGIVDAKPCSASCSTSPLHVDSPLCSSPDSTTYRSMVGALNYLTFTRPDISFAVSRVSQFMHSPTLIQLVAVKRILRYLRGNVFALVL